MTVATIQTQCNTATGTRVNVNRLGMGGLGQGRPPSRLTRLPSATGAEPSPVPVYIRDALMGFEALCRHRRQEYANELVATVASEIEVESELTQQLADWQTALEALVSARIRAHSARAFSQSWWTYSLPKSVPDEIASDEGTKNTLHEPEMVDWDVRIEQLPPRRSEQVVVRFTQGSYRSPRIIDDPED